MTSCESSGEIILAEKRYFWLKLKEDFFADETMRYIEEQENGYKYSNIYLKLLLKSIDGQGVLIRKIGTRLIPYDVAAIAKMTGHDQDTVRVAMKLFEGLGMIERLESGALYMSQLQEMVGSESASASRVRALRERQKQLPEPPKSESESAEFTNTTVTLPLHCNADVTEKRNTEVTGTLQQASNCNPRYRDRDIEIDKEKKKRKKKASSSSSQSQKDSEAREAIKAYTDNLNLQETLEQFLEMRKEIKKPMTGNAVKRLTTKLDGLATTDNEKIAILEESIINGWQSVWPLKNQPAQPKKAVPDCLNWGKEGNL